MDVARILLKTIDELKNTDISKHALDALSQSKIKEVHIIGRRGPVQAAYTPAMLKEFGELADAYPIVDPKYLQLNPASQAEIEGAEGAQKKKNYDALKELAAVQPNGRKRKLIVHYFKSPAAMYGDDSGKLNRIYLERNELIGEAGHQKSRSTGEKETIHCGLAFNEKEPFQDLGAASRKKKKKTGDEETDDTGGGGGDVGGGLPF
jgi:ferredoxin--NADP+ reductase